MTTILDGKSLNESLGEKLKQNIEELETKPHLAIIQIGHNKESNTYIKYKKAFGEKIGAQVTHLQFEDSVTEEKIIKEIEKLNKDQSTHGIIVQLPLPTQLNKEKIIDTINPQKDVDGLTSINTTALLRGNPLITPATTRGIITMLKHYNITIQGKHVVVVGRSNLVGKPTALAMLNEGAAVTVCHSGTKDLAQETKLADILIVAIGKPKLIGLEHVSKNQIVIDVGINSQIGLDKNTIGDVDFETVKDEVQAISPVPKGVGPMTVLSLFQNLLDAYKTQI